MLAANHFHNRNQSMDVGNANKIKNKLQTRKNRLQPLSPQQSVVHDSEAAEGGNAIEETGRFKGNNNSSRGGAGDYI